jgi:hypothetical protein
MFVSLIKTCGTGSAPLCCEVFLPLSIDTTTKKNIYGEKYFALDITGHGGIACQHGQIVDISDILSLSMNLFLVSQLTKTGKIVDF